MAIQMRRGSYANFDPSRMLPGEWAVVLEGDPASASGKTVYMCFAANDVRRFVSIEDMQSILADLTDDVIAEIRAELDAATAAANSAAAQARDAKDAAQAATQTANQAAETAESASERAEAAIEAMGDISEQAVPLMSADTRGGAKLGAGLKVDEGKLSSNYRLTTETVGGDTVLTLEYELD